MSPINSIFRERTLQRYYHNRQEHSATLQLASTSRFVLLWILLLLGCISIACIWLVPISVMVAERGVLVEQTRNMLSLLIGMW